MGEIKSTLEIIMEKTKNLTMTEEEKKDMRQKELAKKVKGWVQKYIDNLINQETLKSELKKEGKDNYSLLQKLMKKELLKSLEPDGDNTKVFQLIKGILDIKKDPFVKIINQFQREMSSAKSKRQKKIKEQLTKKRIFGSAVIPNLNCDTEWNNYYSKAKNDFKKEVFTVDT